MAPLAEDLLQTVCEDRTGACAAGVKPHLAGLLTALTSEKSAAREKVWVGPLASFVARSIDESAAMLGSAMEAVDQDENAPADGNMPQSADQGAQKAVLIGPSAALLSDSLDAAAVKQFVQAAKLVKASEVLAGQAAAVAEEAWLRGDAAGALGAVELAQALGFTGVTVRGKSRAGGDSYAAAISKLRVVQSALESEEGDAAHATGPKALLRSKMLALFPPPPRVTFEGAMV